MSKRSKTGILMIAPETGRLPRKMGPLARYISAKSGGLGEVVAALCEGLTNRGVECHLTTINLKRRFQEESRLNEEAWYHIRHHVRAGRIHLVKSSIFSHLSGAYEGNPVLTAAEFQKQIVNSIIIELRALYGGKLIIHSHDWMAGGIVSAYARYRACPILHTVHNVHTALIPVELLLGADWERLRPYLYFACQNGGLQVDCQATAIKNANLVNFVGQGFLDELVNDYFTENGFCPESVRQEVKVKHAHGQTLAILNSPSPVLYPEHCPYLVQRFGPDDKILEAKRTNLVEFQRRTGLNVDPRAILLYWPSRLDPVQKGIHLLEEIAHRFVIAHGDVQIALVGNRVGLDRTHEEICGRIACSSGGKIAYHRFDEELSLLGFAAASDVFGASLYEPCGQIDQIGNLHGATATNRDTGGYHDKIRELTLANDGAAADDGNGFLFRDYDPGGLWYGLERSVAFHRRPDEVREPQLRRIMRETRERFSLDRMVDQYLAVYERLNDGVPLV